MAEVFCTRESTFDFAEIDQGKIICVTMPQKFQTERRYVNTFLKLLYYNHALRRFDKSKAKRAGDNLLLLWADEAQRFMTASEDGTSDYNCVDVIREAGATIIAAAQSTTSFLPPLGNDKSKVLTLNLRNRIIFRAADEADAVQAADFLGKRRVVKRSWGYSAGRRGLAPHNTYLELLVESGILGFTCFMAIVVVTIRNLLRAGRYWAGKRPEYAHLCMACMLSIGAFLATSLFLHLAFPRYFWLLMGLAGAAAKTFDPEEAERNLHRVTGVIVAQSQP